MTLTAPVPGTVQALSVTTLGQFVSSGQELMQVMPEGSPLEIEAYVLNQDIGFVRLGQDAVIKIDSFPFTRYGTLSGKVVHVASDALPLAHAQRTQEDPSWVPGTGSSRSNAATQQTQDLVFPVTVVPTQSVMLVNGKQIPLSPGMTVKVEIKTDKRRILEYILAPLLEIGSTAFRER
jgi:hemolysin D